jgi:hypothetical protein
LKTRWVEDGFLASLETGRIGRGSRLAPQLGQRPPSLVLTHSRQKVHSKVQIIASVASGGKSLSQHSQLGLNSSKLIPSSECQSRFWTPAVSYRSICHGRAHGQSPAN